MEVLDSGRNSFQEDNMGSSITYSNLDKISQNGPAFSSSIHSRLSGTKPLGVVLTSKFNSSKPHVQLFSLDTSSLKATNLSCQERVDWLSLSQPVVNINPHVLGFRSLVKMKTESSVFYSAFSRDGNDAIWSKHEDFKVPSTFQNQANNFGITAELWILDCGINRSRAGIHSPTGYFLWPPFLLLRDVRNQGLRLLLSVEEPRSILMLEHKQKKIGCNSEMNATGGIAQDKSTGGAWIFTQEYPSLPTEYIGVCIYPRRFMSCVYRIFFFKPIPRYAKTHCFRYDSTIVQFLKDVCHGYSLR